MIIPYCIKCGNSTLTIAPRKAFFTPIQLYCTECGSFWDLYSEPNAKEVSTNLVSWRHL